MDIPFQLKECWVVLMLLEFYFQHTFNKEYGVWLILMLLYQLMLICRSICKTNACRVVYVYHFIIRKLVHTRFTDHKCPSVAVKYSGLEEL